MAYAHVHVGFDLVLYILKGKAHHEFGPDLTKVIENEGGDFNYIKPGVPHEVFKMSETEPVVAFVARSSAEEQDGASFNGTYANDIGRTAFMSYRRRWIAQHEVPENA